MPLNRFTTDKQYKIHADTCPTSADSISFAGDDQDILLTQILLDEKYLRILDQLSPKRKSRPDLRHSEGELYLQLMSLKERIKRTIPQRN